jgi:hypothetical protein
LRVVELRRTVRFAVERPAVLRRAVVLRPPRFAVLRLAVARLAVPRFAVPRFAVLRFAVVLRRAVERFAVVFRPRALVLARRRTVFRPPLPPDDDALIGDGGGGVGLDGIGVGQTEPGSFCADQSVPSSSCMVPPQKSVERSRDAYRIPVVMASTDLTRERYGRSRTNTSLASSLPRAVSRA